MKESTHSANADIIERKVRKFIGHYYTVKTLQGLIITVVFGVVLLFFSFFIDYIFNLNPVRDGILFWLIIIILGLASVYFILFPLAQRMGIIKGLDYKKAGALIAEKHEKIEDKIVNIIELNREKGKDNQLFDEAINQKSENIKWYNFNQAVSVRQLIRLLIKATLILFIGAGFSMIWPEFVKNGYKSVIQYRKAIDKSGIEFRIINNKLRIESGKDFTVEFEIISSRDINTAEINTGGKRQMVRKEKERFSFTFFAVNNPVSFTITAEGQESPIFRIDVLRRPEIAGMNLEIIPPEYTGLEKVTEESDGNVEIPSGSIVKWNLRTAYTDTVMLLFEDTIKIGTNRGRSNYSGTFTSDSDYKIICRNSNGLKTEYEYKVLVVKDLFPEIDINESIDSLMSGYVYINGSIEDDFGFSRLDLVELRNGTEGIKKLEIKTNQLYQEFYHTLKPDTVETIYFLRVYDNDLISGYKFTESRRILLKRPSLNEIAKENSERAENISKDINEGIISVEKLEEKILQFRLDNLSGEMNSWEIQERIKEIIEFKNNLLNLIENIQNENAEYTNNEELLDEQEMVERAKEIQELIKDLMDDELKELLEQFEKLSKEYNERLANEMTEELELNMEKLKEQMEMSLELLKKFEINKEIEKQIAELEKLSEKIENDIQGNKKEEIKDEFKKWENKYEENLERNNELKKPLKLEELKKEREETRDSVNQYGESGEDNNSLKRNQAASRVMRLAREMEKSCGSSMDGGKTVDIEELRQIRNALNEFSHKQEALNEILNGTNRGEQPIGILSKDQKILEDKFSKIRDSLKSIGFNQPIVAQLLEQEMFHVETSFRSMMESFQNTQVARIRIEQNRIMNEINIMALKMDELIKNSENQIGTGSGKKGFTDSRRKEKGESEGSDQMGETKNMQEALKEQLKNALQQMKEGKSEAGMRKNLAKMLGEREMMRKAAERLSQKNLLGQDARERLMQAIEMMKEIEKDIIYDRMGDHTLEKDEWIRTRLLEAENAEKERENDNRRESKEFTGEIKPVSQTVNKMDEPNKLYKQTLKYKELKLRKFYQDRYQEFIQSIKK
ncbi:MAG: hypothetical protein V2A67_08205 [Bacteroidota bacterium]